jgi:hypothetical protein
VHQHAPVAFFHFGHGVGFQAPLFSDKGLYEHFGRFLSCSLVGNYESKPIRGAPQTLLVRNSMHAKEFNHYYTFRIGARKRYWGQHLWARGYLCATVGAVDEQTIKAYIENQKWDEDEQGFKITAPTEP